MAVDHTASLPIEVLLNVLGYLRLADLARFATISKRWASIIKRHPTYWLHPQLVDPSPSAVAFFNSRLAAAEGKQFEVRIILRERFTLLDTTLLPNLTAHLDRIVHLMLHVHIAHAEAVFDLLAGPASSLRHLQLFFRADTRPRSTLPTVVTLPRDILCRGAHPLGVETVLFQNIDIVHPLPPALSSAVNLVYYRDSPRSLTTMRTLASAFPNARDVSLVIRDERDGISTSEWPPGWDNLDSLMLPASGKPVAD
ncbi:hypothetical protein AURDEDRAFT_161495 [Auricularia subglabra TFB-10046 SS5]|nr:hypothetical protein AURDEDRAFT_161495 [Auricularia subglabra TFB-10046 SS5]